MLDVKVKLPEELILEKQLRDPLEMHSTDDPKKKYIFFRNKVKDFINYHLDYAKYNKKIISETALDEIRKHDDEDSPIKIKIKKTIKYQDSEKNPQIQNLRENLLKKVSNLERVSSLVKSAHNIFESLENIESLDLVLSKISNTHQIFYTIQEILNKEFDSYHGILTLLDSYHQKQSLDLTNLKQELNKKHQNEIESMKSKFENRINALVQHNKALSSKKYETKLQQAYKDKIESLESQIMNANSQLSEKSEHIRQKMCEVSTLKQCIDKKNEELIKYNDKIKDLESLINIQQESYHGQIYDLTSEIARIKNNSQESLLSHQLEMSQIQYTAESTKNRLDQVLAELTSCGEQMDYMKLQSQERERYLENENNELRIEIERLERIVMNLKEELDRLPPGLEIENLKISSMKQKEENKYLNDFISKLEKEGNQMLDRNQELFIMNQKLESELARSRESRSMKSSKSEKKIRKK